MAGRSVFERIGVITIDSRNKALSIAGAAAAKKGRDIKILNMKKVPTVCDYFVISSGTSSTHVRAVADNIEKVMKESGQRLRHSEGSREALWILLDYGDVAAHIFFEETRRFYNLEKLWGDVPQTSFKEESCRKKKIIKRKKNAITKKRKKPSKARSRRK